MKNIIIIITVLAVVGIGAYYMSANKSSNETSVYTPHVSNTSPQTATPVTPVSSAPKVPVSSTPTKTLAPTSIIVSIKNFSFNPPTLTIKTGTKVTWINNDNVSHTVTSDSGNILHSDTLSPGRAFSFTFVDRGSANYHCNIHPSMKGVVNVE